MLTPRERQVLGEVTAGRLNKQIAADLGTVEKTIKVHRGKVMRKLGARSVVELVWIVACTGVVPKSVSGDSAIRLPHLAVRSELERPLSSTTEGAASRLDYD
jgi:DNA-binding CsgD family transcriptional regulator